MAYESEDEWRARREDERGEECGPPLLRLVEPVGLWQDDVCDACGCRGCVGGSFCGGWGGAA